MRAISEREPRDSLTSRVLIWLILGYRRFLSPIMASRCRFYPSCSEYGLVSISRFGARRGGWLTLRRLGRCHPFHPGGMDPVPQDWEDR